MKRDEANRLYKSIVSNPADARELAMNDLFFLMVYVLNRPDANNDWLYDRCREVEANSDGYLDLWAREHYKSTVITWAMTIQDICRNPEITVGIFSHTRPVAKAFLRQIKRELEQNQLLQELFPHICPPSKGDTRTWSEDTGLVVKRATNPKEATIEAWGLVDGQPTGKHFSLMIYDDVVTRESVTTPDQIAKTTAAWELSLNLGAVGGAVRTIGTRYHYNDTYKTMMDRGIKARIYPATDDGTATGKPILLSRAALEDKRRLMGPYTFASQMLQNPKAEDAMGFVREWLRYYDAHPMHSGAKRWPSDWNYYLLCDPAGEKKQGNDYTVMTVIALAPDQNYYLVDGIRDRLNLRERTNRLFYFHRKYRPMSTGYEKYGKDSDIEHILEKMEEENYHFSIIPLGGSTPKNDRIRKLVPVFAAGSFYIPYRLLFDDYEGKSQDFTQLLINDEYLAFPYSAHDDMLDCIARIRDAQLGAVFPTDEKYYQPVKREYDAVSWARRN